METVLALVFATFVFGGAGTALWLFIVDRASRAKLWRAVAEAAGLTAIEILDRPPLPLVATGWSGSLRVRIQTLGSRDDKRRLPDTRIVVDDLEGPLSGVTLHREDTIGRFLGSREIEIGDAAFDEAFFIGGTPALVFAGLDTRTRAALYRMNDQGALDITSTEVRLDIRAAENALLLTETIRSLLDASERLRDRACTPARLAENARRDLSPATRLQNLLCLVREFGDHPLVEETLRAACADRDPEVRLRAATALGAEGRETLLAMAGDLGLADAWRAAAVSALGRSFPPDRARETLERALLAHHQETARACVEALRFGGETGVEPLVDALREETGLVAATAARVLGALRAFSAEEPLVRALSRDAPGLRLSAAEALGRLGSTASVLPLKHAAERHSDAAFRRAARQAIAEIQGRLPNASPGQLSLTATEAGQLSLANDEAGHLSLAEGLQGRLSLTDRKQDEP